MSTSVARGEAWKARISCDWCDASSARSSVIAMWNGATQPAPGNRYGVKHADLTLVCGWKCCDSVREANPGWLVRTLSFKELLAGLAADILPTVMPDTASEIRLRLELVLSAYPDQWLPAKRVHEKLPGQVRTSGAWQSALSNLVADGKVEVRRTRTNPSARFRTEYLWRGEEERRN